LLIFDEVMTGFRLAWGGAQQRFGIAPDLSCFGKIIGGGLPVGAFGGRAEIMDCLAPLGPVYQAGTLSGNPLAMAAGIAALEELAACDAYTRLEALGVQLETGMREAAKAADVPVQFNRIGSMFCSYFTKQPVHNLADAMQSDRAVFAKFFHGMLAEGVYLAPSQFESGFLSLAHTDEDLDRTVSAAAKVLRTLR
jgi:glutamate-1-semialdehyde 2,1-aminomutase